MSPQEVKVCFVILVMFAIRNTVFYCLNLDMTDGKFLLLSPVFFLLFRNSPILIS